MEYNMKKQEWLQESIFVDIYGREYNLSDVSMTYMSREDAFKKRHYSKKMINQLWKENLEDVEALKGKMYDGI